MPGRLELVLSTEQRAELEHIRDHDPLPYMRERAAALLKISDGQSGLAVATHGLYKRRWEGTVYDWVHRYQAGGVKGLAIRPGRGRKPAFSPSVSRQRSRPGDAA
jgi:transposase